MTPSPSTELARSSTGTESGMTRKHQGRETVVADDCMLVGLG